MKIRKGRLGAIAASMVFLVLSFQNCSRFKIDSGQADANRPNMFFAPQALNPGAATNEDFVYKWPYSQPLMGTSHVASLYDPNGVFDAKILTRGAMDARILGFDTLKIWVDPYSPSGSNFRFTQPGVTWGMPLADLLKLEEFKTVFNMPFKAFFLEIDDPRLFDANLSESDLSDAALADMDKQLYDFTRRLISDNAGTGRVFLIQNHEGDNHMSDFGNAKWGFKDPAFIPVTSTSYKNYEKYFRTRQAAIRRARRDAGAQNVAVYQVCEINQTFRVFRPDLLKIHSQEAAKHGQQLVRTALVSEVLPYVDCDAYGYSGYDATHLGTVADFRSAIDFIKQKTKPSEAFGRENVMLTEFGIPENTQSVNVQSYNKRVKDIFTAVPLPVFVIWQLYDNECRANYDCNKRHNGHILNIEEDSYANGFWMRKASGGWSDSYRILEPTLRRGVDELELGVWAYRLLLGREPSQQEKDDFPRRIVAEGRENFFKNVSVSPEAHARLTDNVFKKALNRSPNQSEVEYWVWKNNGRSLGFAANDILRGIQADAPPPPSEPEQPRPAPPTKPSDVSVSAARVFLTELYANLLNRNPDSGGLEFNLGTYRDGAVGAAGLVVKFLDSDEYFGRSKVLSNEAYLSMLFKAILNRDIDSAGKAFWLDLLDTGKVTRMDVENQLVVSDEFKSNVTSKGMIYAPTADRTLTARNPNAKPTPKAVTPNPPTPPPPAPNPPSVPPPAPVPNPPSAPPPAPVPPTNPNPNPGTGRSAADTVARRTFVIYLYKEILGREADNSGLNFYADGNGTCAELTATFARSDEFKAYARAVAPYGFLSRLYVGIYRRVPDNAGLKYWTGLIMNGVVTRDQVIEEFLKSSELTAACKAVKLPL
ncbi:MAG: DUF4214 domain-containing protein [Bdellovibrionales bacterium]|nr:DUF4214 domain-containing protein [Bdellovibrionales bacterium]